MNSYLLNRCVSVLKWPTGGGIRGCLCVLLRRSCSGRDWRELEVVIFVEIICMSAGRRLQRRKEERGGG